MRAGAQDINGQYVLALTGTVTGMEKVSFQYH